MTNIIGVNADRTELRAFDEALPEGWTEAGLDDILTLALGSDAVESEQDVPDGTGSVPIHGLPDDALEGLTDEQRAEAKDITKVYLFVLKGPRDVDAIPALVRSDVPYPVPALTTTSLGLENMLPSGQILADQFGVTVRLLKLTLAGEVQRWEPDPSEKAPEEATHESPASL